MARGVRLSTGGKVGIAVRAVTPARVSIRVTPRAVPMQAARPRSTGRPMVVKVSAVKRTSRTALARPQNPPPARTIIKADRSAKTNVKRLAKEVATFKAGIRSRIAALRTKIKRGGAGRTVADKAVVRRIQAGRGGYTASSLKRKGKFGKVNDHHLVPVSLSKHPVMKHLQGTRSKPDFKVINSLCNRILLRPEKAASEKRGAHGKGFSMKHQRYNQLIQKRLDRIQKLPQAQWKREVEALQSKLREAFRKGKISLG